MLKNSASFPGEKQNMVLTVGSLTPLKGFDFLIESIAHIPGKFRPPLVIASNFQMPEEKKYLEAMALNLEVELILLDNISDEELVSFIQLYPINSICTHTRTVRSGEFGINGLWNPSGGCARGRSTRSRNP
jgi:glycosyltransferase involved in cell wall biosynthesis